MAESSDPVLLTKRASKGAGAAAVEGVCIISKSKVKWQPNDPSQAQSVVMELSSITSE